MEIPKTYDPGASESKWYKYWIENRYFNSVPDHREPYTIVIPPPNVTGVLHMGHMLNNTIQDILIRKARMEGKNACWVPGTDHASIATEAKVVQKLRSEGIKKSDLSREEFLKHAWEWKEKHGGIILEQLKKLGASCDWDRTSFTMDPEYSKSVLQVFIDLYKKGKIYRGKRMINWDPSAKTALSDEEVIYKEVQSKLFHVRYPIAGSENEFVTIATTRPETILGDTAICIHPLDKRYSHLHGKQAIVPLVNREIPIILDDYVEMDFGTGCLKVTPAHDVNDYELGKRHNLQVLDIMNDDGTFNSNAVLFVGKDRFEVRELIVEDLQKEGYLAKTENYENKVGFSERTDVVIEPRLSFQWFVKMKDLSLPAIESVMNDEIQFHPPKFKNTYRHWMENIKDWCISRQLWWGHRIPAWFYGDGEDDFVIALSQEEALLAAREKSGNPNLSEKDIAQDEDVLDTWFSSWLWPISVFNGFNNKSEADYYYPTNDLVTAPEIMFFWVARMIIAGYEYKGEKPFKNVYYNGIVRDKQGRKMSKSLGNSPDPLQLIKEYGADGVRTGMLFSSPAGNDLLFDVSLCEQGRNFANKLWNAFRLVKSWNVEKVNQPDYALPAIHWLESSLNRTIIELGENFDRFRLSDALMSLYKFIWDDFCSWYLEAIKPEYGKSMDQQTYDKTIGFFETILKLLHPFMPFLTEEIWHLLRERSGPGESIVIAAWPKAGDVDNSLLQSFDYSKEVITHIRNIRTANNISFKNQIELIVKENVSQDRRFNELVRKLANLSVYRFSEEKEPNAFSFMVDSNEYFIPYSDHVDVKQEVEKVTEEINYLKGFLASVNKKLNNERFIAGAPVNVVEAEQKKQRDALAKIQVLEEKLSTLTK